MWSRSLYYIRWTDTETSSRQPKLCIKILNFSTWQFFSTDIYVGFMTNMRWRQIYHHDHIDYILYQTKINSPVWNYDISTYLSDEWSLWPLPIDATDSFWQRFEGISKYSSSWSVSIQIEWDLNQEPIQIGSLLSS